MDNLFPSRTAVATLFAILSSAVFYLQSTATHAADATQPYGQVNAVPQDPTVAREAQGGIRFPNMRIDGNARFVYPSIFDEQYKKVSYGPEKGAYIHFIEYRATAKNPIGATATLDVMDKAGNIVWESTGLTVNPMPPRGENAAWHDSGFATRTNYASSTDADGKNNKMDSGYAAGDTLSQRWKFIDPNSSPFTVKLTITLKSGKQWISGPAGTDFAARSRTVFYTREQDGQTVDNIFENLTKCQMWRVYSLKPGDGTPPWDSSTAPDDSPKLYFGRSGLPFIDAYITTTPRGFFFCCAHGGVGPADFRTIYINGLDPRNFHGMPVGYGGFQGPVNTAGTGTATPYPLSKWLGSFDCDATFFTCGGASGAGGGTGASVIQSYVNAVTGTPSDLQGAQVHGYVEVVHNAWGTGYFDLNMALVVPTPGLTGGNLARLRRAITQALGNDGLLRGGRFDGFHWLASQQKTITTVMNLNYTVLENQAVALYNGRGRAASPLTGVAIAGALILHTDAQDVAGGNDFAYMARGDGNDAATKVDLP